MHSFLLLFYRDRVYKLNLKNVTLTGCEVCKTFIIFATYQKLSDTLFFPLSLFKFKTFFKAVSYIMKNDVESDICEKIDKFSPFFLLLSQMINFSQYKHTVGGGRRMNAIKLTEKYGISLILCNTWWIFYSFYFLRCYSRVV